MLELSESLFDDQVLESSKHKPVLVDFWAPWCGPCRMLGPILEKLSHEYEGRVQFVKINADHAPSFPNAIGFEASQRSCFFGRLKSSISLWD